MAKPKKKGRVFMDCDSSAGCKITKGPAGHRIATPPGFSYSSGAAKKPCDTDKKGCRVQLYFDRGQGYLRFCTDKKKPGRKIPVSSAAEASRISSEVCKCWSKTKDFDKCVPKSAALGGLRGTSKKRKRGW